MIQFDISQGSHREIITPPMILSERDSVHLFTDGACKKDGTGGYSCVVQWQDKMRIKFGCATGATSQTMELHGILVAVKSLESGMAKPAVIVTDSSYCEGCFTKWAYSWRKAGWVTSQAKPVKNRELIEEIYDRLELVKKSRKVKFVRVKGHKDKSEYEFHKYNCLADDLATQAKDKQVSNIE